jgi:SAM-dependent methyltransferase
MDEAFRRLRKGEPLEDEAFDRIYPEWARQLSRLHWTPLEVVRRAVALLTAGRPEARLLDVGSGAGKFCLAGALIAGRARFTGIERRPHLARLSARLASCYRVPRVAFVEGDLEELDWGDFNGIYLYNPFEEHRSPFQRIDDTIEVGRGQFERFVRAVERKLELMPTGTRLVTYHGFGGRVPPSYSRFALELLPRGPLECWVRIAPHARF